MAVPGTAAVVKSGTGNVLPLPGTATHAVTIARATWPGAPTADAPTVEQLTKAVTDSATYWREQSGGRLDFAITAVIDDVQLKGSPCLADEDSFYDAISASGWSMQADANLVIGFPHCNEEPGVWAFAWGNVNESPDDPGIVFINGARAIKPGTDGTAASNLGHEWGHNLGLNHANELICSSGGTQVVNAAAGACRNMEYAGVYSIMGGSPFAIRERLWDSPAALGAHQSYVLGFTDASTLTDVLPQSSNQTFTISPVAAGGGMHILRFTDSDGNGYYLEYRTAVGQDAGWLAPGTPAPLPSGVIVTKVFAEPLGTPFASGIDDTDQPSLVANATEYMLDANPASHPLVADPLTAEMGEFEGDAAIPVGTPLQLGDVTVTVTSQSADGAAIDVDFPPDRPAATVPSTPAPPTAELLTAGSNHAVQVTWTPPAGNGGAFVTGYTVTASPGGVVCTAVELTPCLHYGVTAGTTYSYTVAATNPLGESATSSVSNSVTVPAAVPEQPTAPIPPAQPAPAAQPVAAPQAQIPQALAPAATTVASEAQASAPLSTSDSYGQAPTTPATSLAASGGGHIAELAGVAAALVVMGCASIVLAGRLPARAIARHGGPTRNM